MEIKKHGQTYQEMICLNCHCEFTFTGKDLEVDEHPFIKETTVMIRCPECGTCTVLFKEEY